MVKEKRDVVPFITQGYFTLRWTTYINFFKYFLIFYQLNRKNLTYYFKIISCQFIMKAYEVN